jgi:hypothetical protein
MGPLRLYEVFNAMKFHWTTEGYNFIKFKGRVKNLNKLTLDQSSDRNIYYKVHEKYKIEKDFVLTLIPLFLKDENIHISYLLGNQNCDKLSTDWYMKIQRMPTFFAEDCALITSYVKEQGMTYQQFFLGNPILDFLLYDKISIETFIILNKFIFFLAKNKKDSIIYRQMYDMKVQKYGAFISVDLERYRKIFEKEMRKAENNT